METGWLTAHTYLEGGAAPKAIASILLFAGSATEASSLELIVHQPADGLLALEGGQTILFGQERGC